MFHINRMELGMLKNVFEFVFIIFLVQFIGNNKALAVSNEQQFNTSTEYKLLKLLVAVSRARISYGKVLAKYKWKQGSFVFDEIRERAVLQVIERNFKKLSTPYGPDEELFFVDLIEGARVIDYDLYRNWFANDMSEGQPTYRLFSLHHARDKMIKLRTEIIKLLPKLKELQYAEHCHVFVTKAVHEIETSALYLIALQRTFGNFCKKQIRHKPETQL